MLGGNCNNPMFPVFLDDQSRFQFPSVASNQLQLFGNIPAECNVDPEVQFRNDQSTHLIRHNKRSRDEDEFSRQQKLHVSLKYKEEADRTANNPNQNIVSTGLRLSYDDDERNSSITSASRRSITATPSIILSLTENIRNELDRQTEEFDYYMKIQEENFAKGTREMKQRHTSSFLTAIEKGVTKKLLEKDLEIENMNSRNAELVEKIKQLAMEAQNWQYRAKCNESVVNILKTNLQQAISQGAEQVKEGFGDSEVDDAASYIDLNKHLSAPSGSGKSMSMICRGCKSKEVNILLMPCRHLCLCKDCDVLVNVCPICQSMKMASVQVYLS